MAPVPPEGLTVPSLIAAKGAQLKFWTIQANETAGEKVMNISGTVDLLRTNLASYYGLDLTLIPHANVVTAPTINQDIRNRQWDDLAALGVEWKETVQAGRVFKLILNANNPASNNNSSQSILAASHQNEDSRVESVLPTVPTKMSSNLLSHSQQSPNAAHIDSASRQTFASQNSRLLASATSTASTATSTSGSISRPPAISSSPTPPISSAPLTTPTPTVHNQAAILEDLSSLILGLERCDGLREIVQQIESGAVKKIRDRYGPAAPGRRGTADPMWSKYSNLVSKRERLGRILEIDFVGDKDRFFAFFSVLPPNRRKKQKVAEEPSNSTATEHFRAFRRIVEAHPWCEADLAAERRKAEYLQQGGEFSQEIWDGKWGQQNIWEVWRVLGGERYTKVKDGDSNKQQVD
ncbi:hypothetical protein C8J57DRAFT_1535016 [Mycena rebaudengoi]|nr:hypothetical protein C8J57DRAFT_1535016 [Mycena rebaudengoi]